jgi:hypothetical protein
MEIFRKIVTVEIEGIGEVFLKKLSAGVQRRVAALRETDECEAGKGFALMAELIAASLVGQDGKPVLRDAQQALDELDAEVFARIGNKILEVFFSQPAGDAGKNSSAGRSGSSPTA